MTKAQREVIKTMFGGKCAYCGHNLGKLFHADHVEPIGRRSEFVHKEGRIVGMRHTGVLDNPENDRMDNLFPACPRCNIAKNSLTVEEFRRWIAGAPGRVVRYENPMKLARDFGLLQINDTPVVFWFEKFRIEEKTTQLKAKVEASITGEKALEVSDKIVTDWLAEVGSDEHGLEWDDLADLKVRIAKELRGQP